MDLAKCYVNAVLVERRSEPGRLRTVLARWRPGLR
jgi:hypothetical protein